MGAGSHPGIGPRINAAVGKLLEIIVRLMLLAAPELVAVEGNHAVFMAVLGVPDALLGALHICLVDPGEAPGVIAFPEFHRAEGEGIALRHHEA